MDTPPSLYDDGFASAVFPTSARGHRRFKVQLPVSIRDGELRGDGNISDLSLDGCRFRTAMPLKVGDSIALSLHLPYEDVPVTIAAAVVRWNAGPHFGMDFVFQSSVERDRLLHLLLNLEKGL